MITTMVTRPRWRFTESACESFTWNTETYTASGDYQQTFDEVVAKESLENGVRKATVDGQTKYVIPVKGRGLWGGLWGYISVNEDKQNVFGAYFNHESETAGLGARIKERWFQEQFNGKPIFDASGNVALTVVKAGASQAEYEVDGVTGATLTSKGVASMVLDGLKSYESFLKE